jgi:4-hydroxyphenylpyruvate dioxygenase
MELRLPATKGIGGAPLYLIDRFEDGKSIYDIDFEWLPNVVTDADKHPRGHGLLLIDHLTHNVYRGRMAHWAHFYEHLFNFKEIRYFDIQGAKTGLTSKALTAPDDMIRIPLNEESARGSGQIEEYLMQFNGEDIQHIALLTDDICATVDSLQMAGAADDRAKRILLRSASHKACRAWRGGGRAASAWYFDGRHNRGWQA